MSTDDERFGCTTLVVVDLEAPFPSYEAVCAMRLLRVSGDIADLPSEGSI